MKKIVLVINAGSSSIKFALFEFVAELSEKACFSGQIDGIGTEKVQLVAKNQEGARIADKALAGGKTNDHKNAFNELLTWFSEELKDIEIVAIGHRVVHGGQTYGKPIVLSEPDILALSTLSKLAPLHQPHNIGGIRALQEILPNTPQVACFDTAFHRTQARIAQIYGLPRQLTNEGLTRYGFHGISYEYIASVLGKHTARADSRVVVAHLGNGASMTSMLGRRCVATTMGFSTLDGLLMGTRCGPIDPGVILHLLENGMSVKELAHLLYKESGLLGVSGLSQDMRTLVSSTEPDALEAVELFCYRVARELASLSATIKGLDLLVFTGGIGENSVQVRQRLSGMLRWQGVMIDEAANKTNQTRISTPESAVEVLIIPTNEELMIARHTQALLKL